MTWDAEVEKDFFWVYDDLHCPHPVSPMFFDIGGWWLSCDHMFRRFGTPFAVDWLAKNVNGYVYTTAIPADPDLRIDATEYSARYGARVPRDAAFATTMGAYLDTVLPVYGRDFADWWRDRLRPEMERNFAFLEERLDAADGMSLADVACLLEDAIDVHDRHWKIHWMLNFAQLSATLNLRAVMEKHRGRVDEPLLGRLQNSASDRNWDSIEALWRMKNEVRDDAELRARVRARGRPGDRRRACGPSERGRRFIAERVEPYQREFGWHAVWSHEFIFPTVREQMEPVLELVRGYLATDYDFPSAIEAMRRRHRGRLARDPRRADRRGARGDAARRTPSTCGWRRSPRTTTSTSTRARTRTSGWCSSRSAGSWSTAGRLDQPDDVMFLRYNELRALIGERRRRSPPGRSSPRRRLEREAAARLHPRDWVGTVDAVAARLPVSRQLGLPGPLPPDAVRRPAGHHRPRRVARDDRGDRPRRAHGRRVRRGARRRHPRLPDDEPGLGRPVHQDRRARHRHRRDDVASGRPRA